MSFRVRNNQTLVVVSPSNPPNYWTPDNSGNIINNNSGNVNINGNFLVDTNTLFVDSSNNRVGILSTTPQNTIDVNGTLSIRSLKITCDLSANALISDYSKLDLSGNTNVIGSMGVGTNNPSSSAILDLSSTSKGFLPPRMTGLQANNITPVDGLMLYISDSATVPFTTGPGIFGRVAGVWQKF